MNQASGIYYKGWTITEKKYWSIATMGTTTVGYEAVGPRGQKLSSFTLRDLKIMINNMPDKLDSFRD